MHVVASGQDDGLNAAKAYADGVIAAAREHGSGQLLCDERQLQYRLGAGDTWAMASYLAEHVPRLVRVALVYRADQASDAQLWENTAWTRGLECRTFSDIDAARNWLYGPGG